MKMAAPAPESTIDRVRLLYRFGVFELDTASGDLRKQGSRIKLQPQPRQILELLLQRAGQSIAREDLCRHLWPDGTFVDFERGVNTAVNRLRSALGDDAENPRYIETLARTGYRFIAPVQVVEQPGAEPEREVPPKVPRRRFWSLPVGSIAAVTVVSAAWMWTHPAASPVIQFRQITFRRGQVSGARFASDKGEVVYSAQWERDPRQLYLTRSDIPISRPLGLADWNLSAVARTGDLALLRSGVTMNISGGDLFRSHIQGGAATQVDSHIMSADLSSDGTKLALVRVAGGFQQLEFPAGCVLYQTAGWIGSPRISKAGNQVAFIDHPIRHDDAGGVKLVDASGHAHDLTGPWASVSGIAWHPNGELWLTATRGSGPKSLWAVSTAGRLRPISQAPGALTLKDIGSDGKVLAAIESRRLEMAGRIAGQDSERSFTWMDWSRVQQLSSDGKLLLFDESGEGVGASIASFLHHTDTGETLSVGGGLAQGISPDGKSVLLLDAGHRKLRVVPVTGGKGQELAATGLAYQWVRYFDDGKRILVLGNKGKDPLRLWVQDVATGGLTAVTDSTMVRNVAISPDGLHIAMLTGDGVLKIQPVAGGPARDLAVRQSMAPLRWSRDGKWIFALALSSRLPGTVWRIEADTGKSLAWRTLLPSDPMGVNSITGVAIADDEQSYVYSYRRVLSALYTAEGWR
jgi:DNA-binding winged helix-turn-helix (wHTH) protein/WD40 repeat protein